MICVPGHKVILELCDKLGIPRDCKSVTIRIAVNEVVSATYERDLDKDQVEDLLNSIGMDEIQPVIVEKDLP